MDRTSLEFQVAATVERAFSVWTTKTSIWWPRSHTMGGDEHADLVFETHPGGRIFERTTSGDELDWGEVVAWDPPRRVSYLWHLFFDRSEATEVEVSFEPSDGGTRVRIEQRGFDRLGDKGVPRQARTDQVWSQLIELYRAAV